MQITINLNELTPMQRDLLQMVMFGADREGVKPHAFEQEFKLPLEEAQTEEKPKRGRKPKEETVTEQTETASDDVETPKELPTQPETHVEPSAPSSVTLSDVKNKAQTLVQMVNRDAVKSAINKYAETLSDVKESDYEALMQDFAALEASK